MKNNKGFTLIELLIVIAIIAILAAAVIIVIQPGDILTDAREATRESHMSSIGTAAHLAVVQSDSPFDSINSIEDIGTETEGCDLDGDNASLFNNDCAEAIGLAEAPTDPGSGDNYYWQEEDGSIKIWANDSESEWDCDYDTDDCTGTTFKTY